MQTSAAAADPQSYKTYRPYSRALVTSISNHLTKAIDDMAHVDPKASPGLEIERHDSENENLEKGEGKAVDNTDEDEEFSYEEQRKIIHRIDRRLVVILGYVLRALSYRTSERHADCYSSSLMYCVSLIDRGNM
jgi:hypothetical protein